MIESNFKDVPNTHNDVVDITVDGKTIRVSNSQIVDQAVKFLCKCRPEVRATVISELANPNQWAVRSVLQHALPCHHACASFVPLVAEQS